MAIMMPPQVPESCKSDGEREIFQRLKDDPETKDWTVLHSLDVAEHRRQIWGEIDFVVIVPRKGVLCLEVKATHNLRREQGAWFYARDSAPDYRGPFKQASEAMHSIRGLLAREHRDLSAVIFYSAVIFPYVLFDEKSTEWHDWQVIDRSKFSSDPISQTINRILDLSRLHLASKPTSSWFRPELNEPSPRQCDQLVKFFRPNFEFHRSNKSLIADNEAELIRFTQEQFECLDGMGLEKRVFFTGPAGTGKTLLALEAAKRGYLKGETVRIVCYNLLLADWLKEQVAYMAPSVTAGTIGQFMNEVAKPTNIPSGGSLEIRLKELSTLAIDALIQADAIDYSVDQLIIDEAQDLLSPPFLDFLDLTLKGGWSSGSWRIFGDFQNQKIFGEGDMGPQEFIQERAEYAPTYSLRVNCRNTPRISQTVELYSGLDPGYSRVLRPDNNFDCRVFFYADSAEQERLLAEHLDSFYQDNFKGGDIIVLSAKIESAAKNMSISPWKDRLTPLTGTTGGQVPYHTIQGFKGMERPAVIITDIEDIDPDYAKSLLYIGLTRGTSRVTALASLKVKEQLLASLSNNSTPE